MLLTVTDVSTSCAVVIFRVKVSCITSVEGIILWYYALVSEVPLMYSIVAVVTGSELTLV